MTRMLVEASVRSGNRATIQAYLTYASKPIATVTRAIADLEEFSNHILAPAGLTDLASQAHQAAVNLGG